MLTPLRLLSITALAATPFAFAIGPLPPPPRKPLLPPPPHPLQIHFDTDRDGVLSAEEIDAAPEVLRKMDRNEDGTLSGLEFRPPHLRKTPRIGRRRGPVKKPAAKPNRVEAEQVPADEPATSSPPGNDAAEAITEPEA